MNQSETINELAAALAIAQGEISHAVKDSENPHFRNKYADLASIWDAVRAPLSKAGLSVTQCPMSDGTRHWLRTTLLHKSGQWIASECPLIGGADMQKLGSALTYARRYALAAIAGVAQDDDDGNGATGKPVPKAYPQAKWDALDARSKAIVAKHADARTELLEARKCGYEDYELAILDWEAAP